MSLRDLLADYIRIKQLSFQGLGADEFAPPLTYSLFKEAVTRGEAVVNDRDPGRSNFDKINELDHVIEMLNRVDKMTADSVLMSAIRTKRDTFSKARATMRKVSKIGPPLSVPIQRIVLQTLLNDFKKLSRLFKTDRAKIAGKTARNHLMKEILEERKREALNEMLERNPFMTDEAKTKFLKTASFQMSDEEKKKFEMGADILLLKSKLKTLDTEVEKMTVLDPVEGDYFRGMVEAVKQMLF